MTSPIFFEKSMIWLTNRNFGHLMELALQTASEWAKNNEERNEFNRIKELFDDGYFWPGRGIDIQKDFPEIESRKFWAHVFFETARSIFDRTIGTHEHSYWQAQMIAKAYSVGDLLIDVVRMDEPRWLPLTRDHIEFDDVVNGPLMR